MSFFKYYIILVLEIISIYILYTIQGYNYTSLGYGLLFNSILLVLFFKSCIVLFIWYLNVFTRTFYNKYFYILLKIYIIIVIYTSIKNIIGVNN